MKCIYLCACRAYHPNYDVDYNDIVPGYHINIVGDMLQVDLTAYDVLIATPPCNYYSRANWRREISDYALSTKLLLLCIIKKFNDSGKPFIVENVRNYNMFKKCGIIDYCNKNGVLVYEYCRHTYFTNLFLNLNGIHQIKDNIQYKSDSKNIYRQGGYNVHQVIEYFLKYCKELLSY